MSARLTDVRQATGNGGVTWADLDAALLVGLEQTRSAKGMAALRCVHAAIEALRASGESITFRAVGALCVERDGGPTAQSIQNNQRAADMVRVAVAASTAASRPRTGRPIELELLERIGEAGLRAELEALLAHRRTLIVEVNEVRAAARRIKALSILTPEMAQADLDTLEQLADRLEGMRHNTNGAVFSDEERIACRDFLTKGMMELGFAIDEPSGEIIDRSQRTVAPRGIASALRTVAGQFPT